MLNSRCKNCGFNIEPEMEHLCGSDTGKISLPAAQCSNCGYYSPYNKLHYCTYTANVPDLKKELANE